MADVSSPDPTPNQTKDEAGKEESTANTTGTGGNFSVEGTSKYVDKPGVGGNQDAESTGRRVNTTEATPI